MATPAFDYGPRLSEKEYIDRVMALHDGASPSSEEDALHQERQEFELMVDRNLGCRFPVDRREALWQVKRAINARPIWSVVRGTASAFWMGLRRGRLILSPIVGIGALMVRRLGPIMTDAEIKAFLDLDDEELVGWRAA